MPGRSTISSRSTDGISASAWKTETAPGDSPGAVLDSRSSRGRTPYDPLINSSASASLREAEHCAASSVASFARFLRVIWTGNIVLLAGTPKGQHGHHKSLEFVAAFARLLPRHARDRLSGLHGPRVAIRYRFGDPG